MSDTSNFSEEVTGLTDNPIDAPPLDRLEDVFTLPEHLQEDERYARWHEEIVTRLRREAQGLPMKTVQTLLLERIAYAYVDMRHKERNPDRSARDRREDNDAWIKMTQEFNRLLEKHNDKLLNEVLIKVQGILSENLSTISDKDERRKVKMALSEEFSRIEL